ncbi:MAG: BTAD domain-containing putative transcriptional regulator, partial [Chloroflexota bacterium]
LLGTFKVTLADQPITTFGYDKVRALLAYLAVEVDRPHRRQALAGLLWPERPERCAHQSLSQALFKLRRAIGDPEAEPPFLLVTPQTLQFNPSSDYHLDVTAFTDLITACQAHTHDRLETCAACVARLQQAVALYQGNFLAGFSLGDSPAFEEWLVLTRERLHRLACEAHGYLAGYFEKQGDYEQALHYARQQVELEPWREETHRQLMRLLALSGQRSAALAQYETCRRLLAEELGLEPEAETLALYEQICDGKLSRREIARLVSAPPPVLSKVEGPPAPFVARERELGQLNEFLNRALAGQGQVVFVTGGPGRGKTALIQEFARRAQAAHPDLIVVGGRGNAHTGSGDPYLPFREVLALLTGDIEAQWAAGVISQEDASRLQRLLPLSVQALLDVGPDLIGTFLPGEALVKRAGACTPGLDESEWTRLKQHVERQASQRGPTTRRQSDLFEQYTRVLRRLAGQESLLLALDDLQWADLGSVNLLFHLGQRIEAGQILIVGAYRPAEVAIGYPEGRHPLEPVVNEFKRLFGAIEIDLGEVEERRFVDDLLDTESNQLGETFRQTLYRQTQGHPLFTVELLRGMQERGDLVQDQQGRWMEGPALDWETLPARVEAVIAERIERLPEPWQRVLTLASVEGETFTAEVMACVQGIDGPEMVHWLSDKLERTHRLVSAQGVRQRNGQHLSLYRFRHYLFQKYLYHHLDPAERVYLHEAVGTVLERLYGPEVEDVDIQLARHFQEAGNVKKAIDYLRQAGERAVRLSANEEAIAHFSRALELLQTRPDSPERAQQEIGLQLALAVPYLTTRGYAAAEAGRAYDRAWELCQQLGETPQLFPVLWSLAVFYGGR